MHTNSGVTPNVVVIAFGTISLNRFQETLRSHGFESSSVRQHFQINDALAMIEEGTILVVWYGDTGLSDNPEIQEGVNVILSNDRLKFTPLLIVGKDANQLLERASACFDFVEILDATLDEEVAAEAVRTLRSTYQREASVHKRTVVEQLDATLEEYARAIPIPNAESVSRPVFGTTIGGASYARAMGEIAILAEIDRRSPRLAEVAQVLASSLDKRSKEYALRLGLLTYILVSELDDIDPATVARAALRHAVRFPQFPSRASRDYLVAADATGRSEMAIRFMGSARALVAESGITHEGVTLGIVSMILAGRQLAVSPQQQIAASAILAADLFDRWCWTDFFNPRRAHTIMNSGAASWKKGLHPLILQRLLKVAAEASMALPPTFALPAQLANAYRTRVSKPSDIPSGRLHETITVSVDRLAPGMRLERPLMTCDGRQLLEANMVLDEDLIWRLWRLSTLRQVEPGIVQGGKTEH